MARPLRLEFPGATYHITSRGNKKQDIFKGDRDRFLFLRTLESVVKSLNWICHAYCLMDNHYHLMIETPDGNLSEGMRQLNGIYTQKFNWAHDRPGHLFEGRFKSIIVEKESYLLELSRYIVLNPVRAGFAQAPEQWRWSSYRATSGQAGRPGFLIPDFVLSMFSGDRRQAQARYMEFVMAGEGHDVWENLKGGVLLGGDEFVKRVDSLLSRSKKVTEIPRKQRFASRPPLVALLEPADWRVERDRRIFSAHMVYGYCMKEIGEHLGLHYSTICKIIKEQQEKGDPTLT